MNNKTLIISFIILTVLLFLLVFQNQGGSGRQSVPVETAELELPSLSEASYNWIGGRIYQNEARGQEDYLTYWGDGEDFPSLGIGHFIWFPEGVDAPFDEQFPDMVSFVRRNHPDGPEMPAWMQDLDPFVPPWNSKQQFDAAWSSPEMSSLRQWLAATQQQQARFIVATFEQRWRNLELPARQKLRLTGFLQRLVATPEGLFALIDYYNFKGLGSNQRERYQGEGWGLVQVLEQVSRSNIDEEDCIDVLEQFRDAAASRLRLRVELSPPERNEQRWLDGWLERLDGYLVYEIPVDRFSGCGFRVSPYLQNPSVDAMTIIWFSNANRAGQLSIWKSDTGRSGGPVLLESSPVRAEALAYHPFENCHQEGCADASLPYLHQIRVTGLEPDTQYDYRVTQDAAHSEGWFLTLGDDQKPLRFIVYADSETEPESTGKHAFWPGKGAARKLRKYPLDQTTGLIQNLKVIQQRQPSFVAIAGDLVQSGGEQRDWDEFWLHNAELASTSVILPALGNHEYFGGPGKLGRYETKDSERAVRKYQSYFDLPDNNSSNPLHAERYYSVDYGPVTLVVLDTTDGSPHQSDQDTNWGLRGENDGGQAPDWHPGSEQYSWLVEVLSKAQQESRFTFVMFHGAPYSSGVHARPPGEEKGEDGLSAQPVQFLTPLFLKFGVDAVFGGHDEMYEHSAVSGLEVMPAGQNRDHVTHFYDVGIGGDGLRGPVNDVFNPHQVFLAHTDAPEIVSPNGVLIGGGKHYGHLEVNVQMNTDGQWQARLDPVYIFPLMDSGGQVLGFERRLYNDSLTLISENLE
jgi:hypothetical protein